MEVTVVKTRCLHQNTTSEQFFRLRTDLFGKPNSCPEKPNSCSVPEVNRSHPDSFRTLSRTTECRNARSARYPKRPHVNVNHYYIHFGIRKQYPQGAACDLHSNVAQPSISFIFYFSVKKWKCSRSRVYKKNPQAARSPGRAFKFDSNSIHTSTWLLTCQQRHVRLRVALLAFIHHTRPLYR